MRYLKTAIAAAGIAPLLVHAQIKKVLITDFIYGSTHTEGRPLCQALVKEIGTDLGFTVEVAAAEGKITADYLKGFDLVVWNSMSQNGLKSATAKAAWQAGLEGGGALVSLHASGDTRTGTWTWYMEGLLAAKYEGHSDVVPADVWIHPSAIARGSRSASSLKLSVFSRPPAPEKFQIIRMPARRPKSAIRLTRKAFLPASAALGRSYQ